MRGRIVIWITLLLAIGVSHGLLGDPVLAMGCGNGYWGGSVECGGDSRNEVPGSNGGDTRPRLRSGGQRPDYVNFPRLQRTLDGGQCLSSWNLNYANYRELPRDYIAQTARHNWELYAGQYTPCPGQPAAAIDPVVYAIQFWQDVPLPTPTPSIAPGWAITGKYAYLETHGQRQHTYTRDTPFGPLVLRATGKYLVDWGDGEQTGPYDVEGGPWPDGQITHTYINVGTYDVVVTEQWSATWRLGGETGTLTGLSTEGRIEDFRVEQVQAVVSMGGG